MGVWVNRAFDRALVRFAILGALVAALGLSACGRKAGLDPPPATAAAVPAEDAAAPAPDMLGTDSEGRPVAAASSQRKHFFLDWLLD
jgi:predicted small lipoprotein YifL